jgi:hypothetical protein
MLPWMQWAFGLLWAVVLELVHLQQALSLKAAEAHAARQGLIRMLHEISCAQLIERLVRNLDACKVCIAVACFLWSTVEQEFLGFDEEAQFCWFPKWECYNFVDDICQP